MIRLRRLSLKIKIIFATKNPDTVDFKKFARMTRYRVITFTAVVSSRGILDPSPQTSLRYKQPLETSICPKSAPNLSAHLLLLYCTRVNFMKIYILPEHDNK